MGEGVEEGVELGNFEEGDDNRVNPLRSFEWDLPTYRVMPVGVDDVGIRERDALFPYSICPDKASFAWLLKQQDTIGVWAVISSKQYARGNQSAKARSQAEAATMPKPNSQNPKT